ncbi:MAG TPA: glycosyltransferase family 39 protein [Verrucomicrobiae bacterium]|nr:glycosyltransferase family 39 protein [Verrucomicrobiae bacterium]
MNRPSIRTTLVLSFFAVVFLTLVVGSYTRESATVDEPHHLVDGYAVWTQHDYRIDPEHPPLVWLWAALPLLTIDNVHLDTTSESWRLGDMWGVGHNFLYRDNDADRLLYRARFMIALLGTLLGILVFCWARDLFGFWPAAIVLGLYCTEPNLVAFSGLVTNDLGATCFMFGAIYFAWRLARQFSVGNLVGFGTFFTLAPITKYPAVSLVPLLSVLLLIRALRDEPWPWSIGRSRFLTARRPKVLAVIVTLGGLLVIAYVLVWAAYGFRYTPSPRASGIFVMEAKAYRWPRLAEVTRWIDKHRLLPNACVQGFALSMAWMWHRQAYLLGQTTIEGWWYYFPIAILIKTPIAELLLALTGLVLCVVRWKTTNRDTLFVVVPPALYLGAAMAGQLNIGLRHVLTVYPFILLLAGWTIAELLSEGTAQVRRAWRRLVLAALCLAQVVEFAMIYPFCLSFFNASVGGARHGSEYLVDSNLDWGQGLKLLGQWMKKHQIHHINLSYFGTADPAYYGINCTLLPGQSYLQAEPISAIRLPGYVAISATNLRGAYLTDSERKLYAPLRERTPVAVLGYSIYVYWIDRPWW